MKRFLSSVWLSVAVMAILTGGAWAAGSDVVGMAKPWQMNFQPPATPVMEKLEGLHHYLLILIACIVVFVMGLLAYVCVRFSHKNNPTPSKNTHNTLIEVIWTVVPVMILVAIAIPSLRLHYFMDRAVDPEMTLKVTGYQWYWGYEYPDYDGLSFEAYLKKDDELKGEEPRLLTTDKPVVVPVDTTVRVLLTSADVIHSWAMPAFGVKTDAVPGRLNETWFRATRPGIYYGQCSELCGVNHGFMPIEIHVVEKDVFQQWVERAKEGNYELSGLDIPKGGLVTGDETATGVTTAAKE